MFMCYYDNLVLVDHDFNGSNLVAGINLNCAQHELCDLASDDNKSKSKL